MTYTVRKQLLDAKRYKYTHPTTKKTVYKSAYTMVPETLTVHNTYNDASAANEANYHNRADNHNSTSYHTVIDDIEAVQVLPFNRNAFAAGDGTDGKGNRSSIHVEIAYSKSGGARYTKAEENAVHYIATLLKQYGWGVDRLRQHYDWSRKNCPHRIRDEKRWDSFVKRVKTQLDALNKPTQPIAKNEPINLTEEQRKVARDIIKYAVKSKVFSSAHTEVDSYTDAQLVKYTLVFAQAKAK